MQVRLIPVICPARRQNESLKITGNDNYFQTRPSPQTKSAIYQKLIPENIFPDPRYFWSRQYVKPDGGPGTT